MITNFKQYLLENHTDDKIRIYAWLFMLAYIYESGMSDKSWGRDNRMGISFSTAMEELLKEKLVIKKGDTWFPNDKSRDKVKEVFGTFTNRKDAEKSGSEFKKYDKNGYDGFRISSIPYDIYRRETEENIKKYNIKLMFDDFDYYFIRSWYKKYQRIKQGWSNKLNKYLGATNDLIMDKKYILYRGIYIVYDEALKIGDYIEDNKISWTTSLHIAKRFAYGNEHYMDNKNKIEEGAMGLVLEYEFNPNEILLDTEFINDIHPQLKGMVDFPQEYEVIVVPKKRKVKIIEIFK